VLDVRQVAVVLGVNVRTVWRRIASGELAVVRFGHCTRFREADLIGFIEEREVEDGHD